MCGDGAKAVLLKYLLTYPLRMDVSNDTAGMANSPVMMSRNGLLRLVRNMALQQGGPQEAGAEQ